MKQRIKAKLKSSSVLYLFYYYLGSAILRFLGCFIRTDENLILFVSYGGQKYDDSPKMVYEYMKSRMGTKYRYIWAFITPEKYPQVEDSVKIDTIKYYLTALKAGYWITNSSVSRGLNFQKKMTKNVLFQHGMAGIKKIGEDIESISGTFQLKFKENRDFIFLEGKKECEILVRAWGYPADKFYTTGLPRNDDLTNLNDEEIDGIKKKLGIPKSKKVILYAPTFRENSRDKNHLNVLGIPFSFEKWERELGDEYVLLITAHYEVAKLLDELPKNGFVINAFKYPYINDLLKVADVLISDYSSIVWDYSILERPIFCYAYDYEAYSTQRGLYTDLEQLFSHGAIRNEDALIRAVKCMDYEKECQYTKKYIKDEYIATYGDATAKSVKIIFADKSSLCVKTG